jgi:hypothetical protein
VTFNVPAVDTCCYDRVQLYDIIQVVHGPMMGKTGHVVDIRPNGYFSVKEIADRFMSEPLPKIKYVSNSFFWQSFRTYTIVFRSLGHQTSSSTFIGLL